MQRRYAASASPRLERGKDSLAASGMINPPPADLPDLIHTSMFSCAICEESVIGNSCLCRGN